MEKNNKKRGRPVGSTNKPKNKDGIRVMSFDKQIENAPVIKKNQALDIIQYGQKNTYPYDLINLYNTSVTHKACIDFATNAIVGDGIDWEEMQVNDVDIQNPNYYMGWTEFIRAMAFDFSLYNAFAFQIIKNKDNKTYSFFPQPIETIRLEEMDEDGVINNAYICKDWSAPSKYPPVKIPMFGFQQEKEIPRGEPYLFYHKQYNPVNAYYGLPVYTSALNCVMAEAQFQVWDLKNIVNGFTPIGALTLPDVETDEERQAVINNVTRLFTGAENSNSVMINFRTNIEDNPIEFVPFNTSKTTNVNLYADANERTINRIMAAHKIPSKCLIGYPSDDLGFSDSGAYMEAAFALYNVNVANNNRKEILDVINNIFKMNGVDVVLKLKPLRYSLDEKAEEEKIDTNETPIGETQTEEEVTEREDNTL